MGQRQGFHFRGQLHRVRARRVEAEGGVGLVGALPVAEVPGVRGSCVGDKRRPSHVQWRAPRQGAEFKGTHRVGVVPRQDGEGEGETLVHALLEPKRRGHHRHVDVHEVFASREGRAAHGGAAVSLAVARFVGAVRIARRELQPEGQAQHAGDRHGQQVHRQVGRGVDHDRRQVEGDDFLVRLARRGVGQRLGTQHREISRSATEVGFAAVALGLACEGPHQPKGQNAHGCKRHSPNALKINHVSKVMNKKSASTISSPWAGSET